MRWTLPDVSVIVAVSRLIDIACVSAIGALANCHLCRRRSTARACAGSAAKAGNEESEDDKGRQKRRLKSHGSP